MATPESKTRAVNDRKCQITKWSTSYQPGSGARGSLCESRRFLALSVASSLESLPFPALSLSRSVSTSVRGVRERAFASARRVTGNGSDLPEVRRVVSPPRVNDDRETGLSGN